MDWQALCLTFWLAGYAILIALFVAILLAAWLELPRRRRIAGFVEAVVSLPLVLPSTVLGFYIASVLGSNSPVGYLWMKITGSTLPYTFGGLLFASVLFILPATVLPLIAAFGGVDRRLLDASEVLGRGRIATLCWVVVPQSLGGIFTAFFLGFAQTVAEFGVVLMVGGNIPGETRTASISIYESGQDLDSSATLKTSLALLGFSFFVLIMLQLLRRKGLQTWPRF